MHSASVLCVKYSLLQNTIKIQAKIQFSVLNHYKVLYYINIIPKNYFLYKILK